MDVKKKNRILAFCRFSIVFVLLLVLAGNITNSVLLKFGFRDDHKLDGYAQSLTLVSMMEGTAPRPYVYRATFAKAAKQIAARLSPELQQKFFKSISRYDSLRHSYFSGVPDEYWTPVVAITYHIVYFFVVLSMVLTLLVVYKLARMHGLTFGQTLGFLAGFSIVYPLTFQQGGYYYDFIEILGVFSACFFVLKRWMIPCTLVIALFSFNKETFFLVPLALFFLHERDVSMRSRIGWLLLQIACCFVSRHFVMNGYDANSGSFIEVHAKENLLFWLNPGSYVRFYNLIAKGIFTPSLQNPLILVPSIVFFRHAWRQAGTRYKRYFFAAFLPVAALFMLFGYTDEARNLSLAFPAIVLIALAGAREFGQIFSGVASDRNHAVAQLDSKVDA
ncbi:hypothetical protein LJ656_33665 [Paraburkholderia sp. MMS20-SJTR3]|uniref:Uncharacterized protein n=1 Tax=Paraburkholderia sejongensis TaxID=2886946 RepID=A0ABS8K5Q4_9BURK|nr:hypothetical protein [Paraburkholderia sp. MMS20-SJTR3]MCC8397499.1 hypothetical protein [Paraburkholderia sp. MMS20-SJTR3]